MTVPLSPHERSVEQHRARMLAECREVWNDAGVPPEDENETCLIVPVRDLMKRLLDLGTYDLLVPGVEDGKPVFDVYDGGDYLGVLDLTTVEMRYAEDKGPP